MSKTLYSIDKKGKIRVFQGEVSLSGPATPNTAAIFTKAGLLDGKLTEKKTVIVNGKQGRSVNQQAEFELASLINEKQDEGYKSYDDLLARLKVLHPTWTDEGPIWQLFKELGITYNTNRYWLPLPMLAEKWKEKKAKANYPGFVQPKLNGVRCTAQWINEQVGTVFSSRGGQQYIMPHLKVILDKYLAYKPDIVFDGELYKHGMPLQKIAGICKLEDPTQFDRKLPIEYHIYDLAIPNVIQHSRLSGASGYVDIINNPAIKRVFTISVFKEEEVMIAHDEFVASGYEGAIFRDSQSLYQFSFRDACLLKVKEFLDEEFEIIGSETDAVGTVDSFIFVLKNNLNDLTFGARPTGSREDKAIWMANIAQYIGKKATVRYQERTVDGLPHQAHVRHKDTPLLIEAIRDYE